MLAVWLRYGPKELAMRASEGARSAIRRGMVRSWRFAGPAGHPPYLVRWDNESGEHLVYPGTEALID